MFILSFNKYLLNAFCILSTIAVARAVTLAKFGVLTVTSCWARRQMRRKGVCDRQHRGRAPHGHQHSLLPPHVPSLQNLCVCHEGCYPTTYMHSQLSQRRLRDLESASLLTYLNNEIPSSRNLEWDMEKLGYVAFWLPCSQECFAHVEVEEKELGAKKC